MKLLTISLLLASFVGLTENTHGQLYPQEYLASMAEPVNNSRLNTPDKKPSLNDEPRVSAHLESIRTADFIEFGSVGFYPNATIMQSSFESEMNHLATYMMENSTINLVIHGHCHGNSPRTTITLGTSDQYFKMNCNNQLVTMSAMELSKLRAENARRCLVSKGISPDRIQVVAEAGNKMIYPLTSLHAEYNDRIELEIIR
jgi:outer membrane protein OmpA-like peptidoglycan-associated protein